MEEEIYTLRYIKLGKKKGRLKTKGKRWENLAKKMNLVLTEEKAGKSIKEQEERLGKERKEMKEKQKQKASKE